jgi:8-oxo-dGTP diphosphatase
MTRYVCGFYFAHNGLVLLIEKKRPEWQRGKYNGIGGHIEPGEYPHDAMAREFREETGLEDVVSWHYMLTLGGEYRSVDFFYAKGRVFIPTSTDEEFVWFEELPRNIISNLAWLVPLARYMLIWGKKEAITFDALLAARKEGE